jgi:hypothetical protein
LATSALLCALLAGCGEGQPCTEGCGDTAGPPAAFADTTGSPPGSDAIYISDDSGGAKPGLRCSATTDCGAGQTCNYGYSEPQCQPRSDSLGVCGTANDCLAGLACAENLVCVPYAMENEPCAKGPCAEPLLCNHGYVPPACRPLGQAGERCSDAVECAPDLVCNKGTKPATCSEPGAEGQPCWSDLDCASPMLCDHTVDSAVCRKRGESKEGEPCHWHGDCKSGLKCGYDDKCYLP